MKSPLVRRSRLVIAEFRIANLKTLLELREEENRRERETIDQMLADCARHEEEMRAVLYYTIVKLLGRYPSWDIFESYLAEGKHYFQNGGRAH